MPLHSFAVSVSQELFEAIISQLQRDGFEVRQLDSGIKFSGYGIVGLTAFSPSTKSAEVHIYDKPWLVSNSMIEQQVRDRVRALRR